MILAEFDLWVRSILPIDEMVGKDRSLNGIQIGREDQQISKIAFAVDASLASLKKAAEMKADILFVHHGLFWGEPLPIRGSHLERVQIALDSSIALYAVHLPLDMHEELGNNAGLSKALGLEDLQPFGLYKGTRIGWKGRLSEPLTCDEIVLKLFNGYQGVNLLKFGPLKNQQIGIISGGASREVAQAVDEGLDLYLTGEPSHENYHFCLEQGINVIAAGHYQTETYGVKLMAEKVKNDLGIETCFIDIPTGL